MTTNLCKMDHHQQQLTIISKRAAKNWFFVLLYTIHKDTMRENGFIHHTFTYNQVPFYAYYCCSIHASPFGST